MLIDAVKILEEEEGISNGSIFKWSVPYYNNLQKDLSILN
jgi:hypothetical protein